jgi:signal transduction histidine kinase
MSDKGDVLIVDDTPANLKVLSEILKERGYRVRPAPNGRLALQAARRDPPDVILLDINMPDMNGYQVCEVLKSEDDLMAIPVIFISALNEEIDKVRAFGAGGIDYVTKPFQVEEVLARVKTHLALRRSQLALERKNQQLEETLKRLKETQSQLVQSEKMASLGVLTAGVAHELNNPVNFVSSCTIGLTKVLARLRRLLDLYDELTPENAAERLAQIDTLKQEVDYQGLAPGLDELLTGLRTGAERATAIIEGLRIFSRVDEQVRKLLDVHENLDSALMVLANELKGSIGLRKEYGKLPLLLGFPGKLNQVFVNVIKNAVDAIKEKQQVGQDTGLDEIVIRTEVVQPGCEPWVRISISDTGSGIEQEVQDHIFEPFFTTKEVNRGIGLGLSISHGIVRDHAGRIEVRSEPGTGTVFQIWLPATETDGERP